MVVFGVLFAVLMVASYAVPAMSAFKSVRDGDSVVIEYTVRDASGAPVITSSQAVLVEGYNRGEVGFLTTQMNLLAGASATARVVPVPIYLPDGTTGEFALLESEIDDITSGVLGMHERGTKTIPLSMTEMDQTIDALGADQMGLNFTELQTGDRITIAMTITDDPTIFTDPEEQISYIRIGTVTGKSADEISVNFAYSTVEVSVIQISQA
ncbi:hypothetical protein CUJ86_05950 [Methanofollis fontis]|uniref:Uncharacterized protein n=2 Tax=Methanofollis fontis TaxID=2052832 RepID=A0A483CTU8_9EURY|nr:hypothetical protein CUJ86_05950 [Methanofollis fontis]